MPSADLCARRGLLSRRFSGPRARPVRAAAVQALETRRLFAAVSWDGGGDGVSWTSAANWSGNVLPTAADDVTIDIAANPTIQLSSGTQTIHSLVLKENLVVNGGTLAVTTTATVTSALSLSGGTLSGGAYNVTGGSLLATTGGGILASVAVTGDVLLNTSSANILVSGTTTFTAARMSAGFTTLDFAPGSTLNSLVSIEGAATGQRSIALAYGGAGTVTFGTSAIVRLAAGAGGDVNIQNSSNSTLVNNGLISAEDAGHTLTISNNAMTNNGTLRVTSGTLAATPTTWTDPGTIDATGGTFNIGGLNTAGGVGAMTTAGGTVNVVGPVANTGSTITLSATSGSWHMFGGTITGGALNLTGGTSLFATNSGGTLASVAITGEVLLNVSSASLLLAGNTTFTAARLSAGFTTLDLATGSTLNSLVSIEGAATGQRNIALAYGGSGTVTFGSSAIVRLAAGSAGDLTIQNSSSATLINNGLISAEDAGHTLTINNSAMTNSGTLAVTAGTLNATPTTWTDPGTVNVSGVFNIGGLVTTGLGTFTTTSPGAINIVGPVTNTGNTVTLSATTGSWSMHGGTITGGALNLTGGAALLTTNDGGTLSSVAIAGELLLNTSSASILLAGNTTFTAARLSGSFTNLQLATGATLNSLVSIEGAATGQRSITLAYGGTGTVTFGSSAIVRLAAGSGGNLTIQNSSSSTLVNNGLISAEDAGHTLTINNSAMTNNGTLRVTAGTFDSTPTTWTDPGTVNATGGVFEIGGLDSTAGVGSFTTAAGTVNVIGTITNTGNAITLNAITGSWSMRGGTITGGSLNLTGGTSLFTTVDGGTLSSVAVAGELLLNVTSASLLLAGNTTFTAARLSAGFTTLRFATNATLNSLVSIEGSATGQRNIAVAYGGAGTVTFGSSAIVRLAAGSGGDLAIQNSSAATLINNGLISAEDTGHTLTINNSAMTNNGTLRVTAGTFNSAPTLWTNNGAINATGGEFDLGGGLNATAGIGTLTTAAGLLAVTGTINNAGQTLTLSATTGSFNISGGTITGGSIDLTGGTSIIATANGGTLSSVAITGEVLLKTTSASLLLMGNTTFTAARLTAGFTTLQLAPGATLNSLVSIEGATTGQRALSLAYGGTGTVTFGPSAIVRLAAGSGGDLTLSDSSVSNLVNNGLITAEAAGRTLAINTTGFSNTGTVRADGSTLKIGSASVPAGTLTEGGTWQLANAATLSSFAQLSTLDLNLAITGTGNTFGGGLIGSTGLSVLKNQIVFAIGASLAITPGSGTLKLAGLVDLGAGARLNVTGNVTFAGSGQPIVRSAIASATSVGKVAATGVVDFTDLDGGTIRVDANVTGGYDPALATRFDIVTGTTTNGEIETFVGNVTPSGKPLLVGRDNVSLYAYVGTTPPAPTATSAVFEYLTREAVTVTFNTNVSAFVSRHDFTITNTDTNQVVANTLGVMSYDATGAQISLLTGTLPDGNYRLNVLASDVKNSAGQTLTAPVTLNFFILRGDINRDRKVNFDDLLTLAQHYGATSGANFATGNIDYSPDGAVSFSDLLLLAQQYGKSLVIAAPLTAQKPTGVTSDKRRGGIAADVLE